MDGFDTAGFVSGFGAILFAFFMAWALGLAAKALDYGGE